MLITYVELVEIAVTPEVNPDTDTGTLDEVVELFPN
jgi:hypothetical protein